MRVRSAAMAIAAAMGVWGCGPPEVVNVVLPGSRPIVEIAEADQAQARGEEGARGTMLPQLKAVDLTLPPAEPTNPGEKRTASDNLVYETLRAGSGEQARAGDIVTVHYVGTLTSGAQFDSSRGRNQPFRFRIGGQPDPTLALQGAIRGWHVGIAGMRVGELRRLTIPPALAYGERGRPPVIPANSTLNFEVELLAVER